jgi:hypothetical protein
MQCPLRRFLSYGLVMGSIVSPAIARADENDPLPPPSPPPARVEPRRLGEPDRVPALTPPPLDRLMGQVGVGAVMLFNTDEHALYQANMGLMSWWKNLGIGGAFSAAHNGSSSFVTLDLGIRGLGSSSNSGPFVGGGFGFRHIALDDQRPGGFRGTKSGAGAYLEVGVIVRGLFTGSIRGDVPFFDVSGTAPSFSLAVAPHVVPIALSAQLGFLL